MPAATDTPVETASVEASQSESAGSEISQAYEYSQEVDADQSEMPAPEGEQLTEQVEGQEAAGEAEVPAQEVDEEGVEKEATATDAEAAAGYVPDQPPEFDAELLDHAQRVGIPEHRARAYSSPDALRQTVTELLWQRKDVPQQQAAPVTPKKPELTVDDYKVGEEFNAEELGEDTAKRLNTMRDQLATQAFEQDKTHRKQVEDLQIAMGGMISQSQTSQHQREVDVFEAHVSQNADLHPLLGKGPMASLAPGSKQAKLRNACFAKAKFLAGAYAQAREPKTAAEICSEATAIVLNGQMKTAARKQVTDKLVARKGQALAKPTRMPADQKSKEEDAQAYVKEWETANEAGPDGQETGF